MPSSSEKPLPPFRPSQMVEVIEKLVAEGALARTFATRFLNGIQELESRAVSPDSDAVLCEAIELTIKAIDAQDDLPKVAQVVDYAGIIKKARAKYPRAVSPEGGEATTQDAINFRNLAAICRRLKGQLVPFGASHSRTRHLTLK